MNIALKPSQEAWIKDAVADGRFASVEEAVEAAVALLVDECDAPDLREDGGFGVWTAEDIWAMLQQSLAELERGEIIDGEQAFAELERQLREDHPNL